MTDEELVRILSEKSDKDATESDHLRHLKIGKLAPENYMNL
jgi:hypothetical protein